MISMAASARIVDPANPKVKWVFKTPQNDIQMSTAIVEHMANNKVKTVAFIGFADAYGEGWYQEFTQDRRGAQAADRRQRALQPHRHLGDRPGAEDHGRQAGRGADRRFRHAGGAAAEGAEGEGLHGHSSTRPTASPTWTSCASAARIARARCCRPARCWWRRSCRTATRSRRWRWTTSASTRRPTARVALSTFGAHAWDAGLLLQNAIPVALKKAQPGTKEFRAALRDALEGLKNVTVSHGVVNMSPQDHLGFDQRARVMVKIENGAWKLQQ